MSHDHYEEVQTEEQFNKILKKNDLVIVDFGATWCGPCKRIAPKFEKLAENNQDIKFIKIDVDTEDLSNVVSKYVKSGIPHFVTFKKGELIDTLTGANNSELDKLVDNLKN
jgi:thioredoxin 1